MGCVHARPIMESTISVADITNCGTVTLASHRPKPGMKACAMIQTADSYDKVKTEDSKKMTKAKERLKKIYGL